MALRWSGTVWTDRAISVASLLGAEPAGKVVQQAGLPAGEASGSGVQIEAVGRAYRLDRYRNHRLVRAGLAAEAGGTQG